MVYVREIRNKIRLFADLPVNKRKTIFLTLIITFGVADNEYAKELVQSEVELEDLFGM